MEKRMSTQKNKKTITRDASASAASIAIIGMASILPEANNLEKSWANFLNELDCIREVPVSRWNSTHVRRALLKKYLSRRGKWSKKAMN